MERGLGPLPGEETIRRMAVMCGRDPDELLAMAGKVATDVLAVITREPAYARFLREHQHLTAEQWDALSRIVAIPQERE
jgi:hypothetical protein